MGLSRSLTRTEDRDKRVPPAIAAGTRRRPARRLAVATLTAGLGVGALCPPAPAAGQSLPPDESWRSLSTEHFHVTFPASLEALGRRTAVLAEDARARLEAAFLDLPGDPVEIVLTDHVDASNGFASVAPYPRIVVYARPPVDGRALSHYDDWLDLVLVHELAHVIHHDRTGGIGRLLRTVFGRVPSTWPFFPGLAAPRWVAEGLATWYESELTDAGRVHGSVFPMYVRTAALEGRLEDVDQASGQTAVWPAGERPYLYGSLFFDWLLERHGKDRMARFVEAVAGQWVPYRLDSAARTAFGVGFSEEWARWVEAVEADARATAARIADRSDLPAVEPLTDGVRVGLQPKVSPDGTRLAYARADGRSDPAIRIEPHGGGAPAAGGAARSVRTNGAAAFDWLPDGGLVFQQFVLDGPWRYRSDLHLWAPDGSQRRLTRSERLDQPSASPDGRWAAAIRTRGGHTDLVRVDLSDGAVGVVASGSDSTHWAFPAVSPDGRWIAAARWTPARLFEVVVVDAATGTVVLGLDETRSVALQPAWAPDGGTLLFVSDRSGIPNVYARAVEPAAGRRGPLRQVTDVATGVAWPSVSPDGAWIHLSLYSADGWEVARTPYRPDAWRDPVPAVDEAQRPVRVRIADAALDTLEVDRYRAARSLRPRYWEPLYLGSVRSGGRDVTGAFVGGATTLADVVERHVVAAGAAVAVKGGQIDAGVSYTWAGWGNPLLTVSASQDWDAGGPFAVGEGRSVFVEERERRVSLGVTALRAGWRSNLAVTASAGLLHERRSLLEGATLEPVEDLRLARPASRLGDLRLSASFSTARAHDLSISPERGVQLFVQGRARPHLSLDAAERGVVGLDRGVDEVVAQARGYLSFRGWGWADHVLALRVAGGRAVGPGADAFWYDIGGAAGQPEGITGLGLFGGQGLFFPVRGYDDGDRSGTRAWTVSGEWRFPLWWANRGWGLLPVFLDRVHGAVFADAGNAWGPGLPAPGYDRPRRDALASVGAELRLDALLLFTVPLRLRLGTSLPLAEGEGARVYVRLGPTF